MKSFSSEILSKCMPLATEKNVLLYSFPLSGAMSKYEINTPKRMAAFLAQVAHESGSLKYTEEIATGDAYDTRTDLGNTKEIDGDGRLYKGRGLIQITGAANYKLLSRALDYNFINNPEKLKMPGAASLSAAWFWDMRKLNELADIDAFEKITKRVNGGLNGYKDRIEHWERCKAAFGI